MELREYQKKTLKTLTKTKNKDLLIARMALGITGEGGEIAEKVKKYLRGDYDKEYLSEVLFGELGDCLWYIAVLAQTMNLNLDNIAEFNLHKLGIRKITGKIKGFGDNR